MSRVSIIGTEGQQERTLLSHNTIGRHPNNTLQVLDRIVSKEHCHIDLENGKFILRDLGSLNGTYVNGERVSEHPLSDGDEITMGNTCLIFSAAATNSAGPTESDPALAVADVGQTRVTISEQGVESHIRTKLVISDRSKLIVLAREHLDQLQ